tara:strand:- start:58804 stop:59727 length:924 start_codon:yes stop_codon:yes gene_type:complete
MNGLFLGTNKGLFVFKPDSEPICEINEAHIQYIESNQNGLTAAIIKNQGLFVRTENGQWQLKWSGEIVSLKITQNNEIIAGVLPTKLIISKDNGDSWQESKGIQSYIGNGSIETFITKKNSQKIQSIIEISGSILIAIDQVGILISHNLGSSWVRSSDGIDENIRLILDVNNDNEILYAFSENSLYRTDDFALNWKKITNINNEFNIVNAIVFKDHDDALFLTVTNQNGKSDYKLMTITASSSQEFDLNISAETKYKNQICIMKLPNSEDTAFLGYDKKVWASHNRGKDWLQIKELPYNILSMAVCF